MTILTTGGAGYIGSHTVAELSDAGERVVVLDDLSTGFRSALPAGVPLVIGDVADAALVTDLVRGEGVDTLIHFAAKTVVPDSVRDPLAYYEWNTAKTRALFEAAIKAGVSRIVFSSTAAVYGEQTDAPVSEDVDPRPISPYGRSKLMSEWILADAAAAHGIDFVVLRYFNVAGADPHGRTGQSTARATHLIKVACEVATGQRDALDIFGTDFPTRDGTCERDYIHVTDLARAHVKAIERLRAGPAALTLNCGYGRGYSVLDVVDAVSRTVGRALPVRRIGPRPGDAASVIAKADRVRSELGWTPAFDDLDTIVAHALAWEETLASSRRTLTVAA
jgi:UDP-glucose 4-epimerase